MGPSHHNHSNPTTPTTTPYINLGCVLCMNVEQMLNKKIEEKYKQI